MKGTTILLDHLDGFETAARMIDGRLDDLLIAGAGPRPGTVYRAIADRPVKGQGGMFLKTPDGPAFLRQVKGLAPGQSLLVQVSGYAEPGKAIPVTQKLLFKSRYAIVTPDAPGTNLSRSIRDDEERIRILAAADTELAATTGYGVILRSACAGADDDDIAEDVDTMLELAGSVLSDAGTGLQKLADGDGPHILAWRDWTGPAEVVTQDGCFEEHGALDAIEALSDVFVPLAAGASMYIEPTRALVAVDVNTGSDASLAAGIKANMNLAAELPRQLRLRGLGGQITLDLAPMPKKDRRTFETALKSAFRQDSIETALVGWTPLGHYELQRKRVRQPLSESLK